MFNIYLCVSKYFLPNKKLIFIYVMKYSDWKIPNPLLKYFETIAWFKADRIFAIDQKLNDPEIFYQVDLMFTLVIKRLLEFICYSLIGDCLMGFIFTQTKLGW